MALGVYKTKYISFTQTIDKLQNSFSQVDLILSRDLDSRFSDREQEAVRDWLNSNKKFHIMRDHPDHGTEILGGTWGCKLTQEVKLLKRLTFQ